MADGNNKKWDRSEVKRDALEKRKRRADGRRIQTESAETDRASEKSVEKSFFRTGIIVVAAFIVMIVASIAWFVSNTRVDATGAAIRPADMPFDLPRQGQKVMKMQIEAYMTNC